MVLMQNTKTIPQPSFSVTDDTNSTGTVTMIVTSNLPCKVCKGEGLVYGKDGKPYLCPKCDGDKVDKSKETYPWPWYPTYPIYPSNPWFGTWVGDVLPELQPVTIC